MPIDDLYNMTVLLVDDEKFSRTLVAGMLADLGRPNVLEAENGADASTILRERSVDFIISDFNMPVVHGLQLLRAVRLGKFRLNKPSTPFALLTGYSERALVDKAIALDTNAFLIKPISKDGLRKRLAKMLKQGQSGHWLKKMQTYQDICVDQILDDITVPTATGRTIEDEPQAPEGGQKNSPGTFRPEAGPIEVRGLEGQMPDSGSIEVKGLDIQFVPDSGSIEVLGVEVENKDNKGVAKYLCPLDRLPEDAELALDVFTSQGTLFMFAGTKLSPRSISILYDLHELGHPVESVWIKDKPSQG